jgi:hypothetical protein
MFSLKVGVRFEMSRDPAGWYFKFGERDFWIQR